MARSAGGDVDPHVAVEHFFGDRQVDLVPPGADQDGGDAVADQVAERAGAAFNVCRGRPWTSPMQNYSAAC
jgi:hypothetical protein